MVLGVQCSIFESVALASRLAVGNPVAQKQICMLQQCISHQVLLWGKLPLFLLCSPLLLSVHAGPIPCVCVHVSSECLALGEVENTLWGMISHRCSCAPCAIYSIYLPRVSALCLLADHWATIPKPKACHSPSFISPKELLMEYVFFKYTDRK